MIGRFRSAALIAMTACTACTTMIPPGPPIPERQPAVVSAPFDRTWEAAIDVFASANLPIETLDKASGLLVPRQAIYTAGDTSYADCGVLHPNSKEYREPIGPTNARFNVVVRGDQTKSTIQVRAFFRATPTVTTATAFNDTKVIDCNTRGVFETQMERRIAEMAQRPR